jgi:AcrR family transcriptional regulator
VAADREGPTEVGAAERDERLLGAAMRRRRSTLPPEELRRRYIELGELVLLEQIRSEAAQLDTAVSSMPLASFAQLDADEVARRVGKTRGSITNLFGSQAAFQLATMTIGLDDFVDMGGIGEVEYQAPAAHADAESWLEALAHTESSRGPRHGHAPTGYAARWTLWASLLPHAVWSTRIAEVSATEFESWTRWIQHELLQPALEHFGFEIAAPFHAHDLALAMAHTIEGLWLSQAIVEQYTLGDGITPEQAARTALTLLWRGATQPAEPR